MSENGKLINEITQLTNQVSYLEQKISTLDVNIVTLTSAIGETDVAALTDAIREMGIAQRRLSGSINELRHELGKMNAGGNSGVKYETK